MGMQSKCWPAPKSSEGLNGAGRSTFKMANSPVCWLEASVPHHIDL